jgi:cytidylate kinase
VEFDRVMQDVRRRDEYDSTRQHGPLAAAPDAIVVDTTGLSVEQVIERVRGLLKQPVRPAVASQEA